MVEECEYIYCYKKVDNMLISGKKIQILEKETSIVM